MTLQANQAEFVLTLHDLVKFQVILTWWDDMCGYDVVEVNGQIRIGEEADQVRWLPANTFHTPETFAMLQDELCDLVDSMLIKEAAVARRAKRAGPVLSAVK